MELYNIIKDKNLLLDFIDWLPDLKENEKYYLSLFARRKYNKDLIKSNDKTQLKRFVSDKQRMYDKIRQLEIPKGRWLLKLTPAPQDSLVLYILPNPRCMKKATSMLGKKCWDLSRSHNYNIIAEATSCVQKSKSRAEFVDFDIDTKEVPIDIDWLNTRVGVNSFEVLETKGGYHILVKPALAKEHCIRYELPHNWHGDIYGKFKVDQSGDQMIPVPGCTQGNFTPKFLK